MARRFVHFHSLRFQGPILLGPEIRAVEMARLAASAGCEPLLVSAGVESAGTIQGIEIRPLGSFDLDGIRATDAVVVSESIAARIPFQLARRGIPFHLDLYGFPPAEMIQVYPTWDPRKAALDRIRRTIRIQFAAVHAERIYLSHRGQLPMLSGIVYSGGGTSLASLTTLESRVAYLPMGIPALPSAPLVSPYSDLDGDAPIFLYGGGIWPWLDNETMVRAFGELRDRGRLARLFFLSGEDRSGMATHREAVRRTHELSAQLDLTGTYVVFNSKSVTPDELPRYLAHCSAGILANRPSLETDCSWRTRYLDLLAFGKPLVVAGADPLARLMKDSRAALVTQAGSPSEMADAICRLMDDRALFAEMGRSSSRLGEQLRWSETLRPLLDDLDSEGAFTSQTRPSWRWILRYASTWLPAISGP